jgi:hypothetical protein
MVSDTARTENTPLLQPVGCQELPLFVDLNKPPYKVPAYIVPFGEEVIAYTLPPKGPWAGSQISCADKGKFNILIIIKTSSRSLFDFFGLDLLIVCFIISSYHFF